MSDESLPLMGFAARQKSAPAPESQVSVEQEPHVLTVSSLNNMIRTQLEGQFQLIWVQGELSNFKAHTSGHFYFSLKDAKSQISGVMFRGYNSRLKFKPHDGLEVIIRGRLTVFEPRGQYQITCELMEPVGAGALQKAFEQLKEKLKAEGLFEASRKRALPQLPRHIAIVTSPTGAAIRDMLNVLTRRCKSVKVTLVPTLVQGAGSAEQICEALKKAWRISDIDAIIIGRGGGSIEDLWAFNDEALARLIASSPVPVISAVGHEVDFTIADFVADLRAPTPSAAAELVVKNAADLLNRVNSYERMLKISFDRSLKALIQNLKNLNKRLVDPKRKLFDYAQRNDELSMRLQASMLRLLQNRQQKTQLLRERLGEPHEKLQILRQKLSYVGLKLQNATNQRFKLWQSQLKEKMAVLDSLSPLKVVDRGYSIVMQKKQLIKSSEQLKINDEISLQFAKGQAKAKVTEVIL